jgi:hypothetical protein
MSKFEYTLPSGAKFVVDGPAGATKIQADQVFYEQVAAGSLVGYTPGQTLTSAATQLTTFELSRLQRGTAGVETAIVLATTSGGLTGSATVPTPQTILEAIENQPVPASMPSLADVPLTNPVDQADVASIKGNDFEPEKVGPLTPYQVQKLLAQTAKLVNQESDQISIDKGIGRYGFTCYALEQVGYVKPGTSAKYFSNGAENFVAVMSSPSVWTGKAGIYSLNDLLSSAETQNKIQVQIMQQGYQQLVAIGAIVEPRQASVSVTEGQVYTDLGLVPVRGSRPVRAGERRDDVNVEFTDGALSTIASGVPNILLSSPESTISRVNLNRANRAINEEFQGDIGSLTVLSAKFTPQATALWAKAGRLQKAGLKDLTGQLPNNITGTLAGSFNSISKNLTNVIPPDVNNLTNNLNVFAKANGFATNFANPVSGINNIGSNLISTTQGQLGGALAQAQNLGGALQGQLGGALAQAQNLGGALQGQLGSATAQAQSLVGNLANFSLPTSLFGGASGAPRVAAGFNNTVNRATVDAAVTRFLGSSKIPSPSYEFPNPASQAAKLDIAQAQNVLKDLQNSAGRTFGQGVTI